MVKKTVLLLSFIFSPNLGGVESHLDDLCDYLIKKNYNVRVITYQPLILNSNAPTFEKRKNFEIHRIAWIKNLFTTLEPYPLLQMAYLTPGILLYSLFYLLKHRKEIDIIQTHGFNMAIIGYLLSVVYRKPFVVNTHVLFYFNKESLYAHVLSFILNKAKTVLVLTDGAKRQLINIGVGIDKITVYHYWINTKIFHHISKKKAREKYKFSEKSFVVLFAGRLIAAKGIHLLISAIKILKNNKNIHFVIAGSGELGKEVSKEALLNPQLHFLGKVNKQNLSLLYSGADICIFPSMQATKTYAEGIPRVMIETLMCGTPLITTNTGGVGEVITQEVGFYIKPNFKDIVKIIDELSLLKRKLLVMKSVCIKYAKSKFGVEKNAAIIEKSLS